MMQPIRVLFMGTPDFAVPSLAALAGQAATEIQLIGVVTRPDKPAGRGRQVAYAPVKQFATEHDIPVFQPGPLRRPEALQQLRELASDLIVVAAFGQILPPDVLALPRHGCLNVHASLLPRWRGASPINAAVLAGDAESGVTIMQMDAGLDTGPILAQRATPIGEQETAGELSDTLATLGAELLVETIPHWLAGKITPQPQDEAEVDSHAPADQRGWPSRLDATRVRASAPATSLHTLARRLHHLGWAHAEGAACTCYLGAR